MDLLRVKENHFSLLCEIIEPWEDRSGGAAEGNLREKRAPVNIFHICSSLKWWLFSPHESATHQAHLQEGHSAFTQGPLSVSPVEIHVYPSQTHQEAQPFPFSLFTVRKPPWANHSKLLPLLWVSPQPSFPWWPGQQQPGGLWQAWGWGHKFNHTRVLWRQGKGPGFSTGKCPRHTHLPRRR